MTDDSPTTARQPAGGGRVWLVYAPHEFDAKAAWFVVDKHRRIHERLIAEGTAGRDATVVPRPATYAQLASVHTPSYLARLTGYASGEPAYAVPELELPATLATLRAAETACGGTLLAARLAVQSGRGAMHIGGGFHHAFAGHGEGFCLLNDIAIAVRVLMNDERVIDQAIVIDLDAHQGNGTAAIFRDEPRVFTFSMHNGAIYPHVKEPGDVDVALVEGTDDATYLAALDAALPRVWAHAGGDPRRTLVVYVAGVDPYVGDRLGGMALSAEGLRQRTRRVLADARDRGLPVAIVLAGGYPTNPDDLVERHADTAREAARIWDVAAG